MVYILCGEVSDLLWKKDMLPFAVTYTLLSIFVVFYETPVDIMEGASRKNLYPQGDNTLTDSHELQFRCYLVRNLLWFACEEFYLENFVDMYNLITLWPY